MQAELSENNIRRLKACALKIMRFMRRNNVSTLVAVGPSAVPAARLILDLWRDQYPGQETPELHSLGNEIEELLMQQRPMDAAERIGKRAKLVARLHAPVLLFDESIGGGSTIKNAKQAFEQLGAARIHTGIFFGHAGIKHAPSVIGVVDRGLNPEYGRVEDFLRYRTELVTKLRETKLLERKNTPENEIQRARRETWQRIRRA